MMDGSGMRDGGLGDGLDAGWRHRVATTTNTRPMASPTPILDREAPLPPLDRPFAERTFVWLAISMAMSIAAVVMISRFAPSIRHWLFAQVPLWFPGPVTFARMVWLVVVAWAVTFATVAIHEGGHALAGLAAGFRFHMMRVSFVQIQRPFRLGRYRGPGSWSGGLVSMSPGGKLSRLRGAIFVLGGPLANFATAAVALALPTTGPARLLCCFFAIVSIAVPLSDLVPYRSSVGESDGRRLWALFTNRQRGERFLALLRLDAELRAGTPPESLSEDAVAKAVALRDRSVETVTAHAIAYARAFHQGRDEDAARLLEICLLDSRYSSPHLRGALMSDAATFQGRRRGRADLAEQWLADMPATIQPPWLRWRAEAAVLGARGDVTGALAKLDEVERAIACLHGLEGRRLTLEKALQTWRSELAGAAARG